MANRADAASEHLHEVPAGSAGEPPELRTIAFVPCTTGAASAPSTTTPDLTGARIAGPLHTMSSSPSEAVAASARVAPALMQLSLERSRRRSSTEGKIRALRDQPHMADSSVHAAAAAPHVAVQLQQSRVRGGSRARRQTTRTVYQERAGSVPVSRRLRRVLNEMYLKRCASRIRIDRGESAEIDDPEELRELFAVGSHSVFADLHESKTALEAFSPFASVTEEQEASMLQELSSPQAARTRRSRRASEAAATARDTQHRLCLIDPRARTIMLGKTDAVAPLIEEIEARLEHVKTHSWSEGDEVPVELVLDEAFHRLLAHGVAQYYQLRSTSASASTQRRAVLLSPSLASRARWPEVTLLSALRMR